MYFEKLDTAILGLSVDSISSHLAWLYDIYIKTGIKITFPIIADRNGQIARKYGMISSDVSNTETVRNVYIIDDKGIIRLILVYPLNVGRSILEIIRCIEALKTADENKGATPANWMPCEKIIMKPPESFSKLLARNEEISKNKNGLSWYLGYKDATKCITSNNIKNVDKKLL